MRKLILFMHTSVDGFVAGLNGEMDWISIDDGIFDFVATITQKADTALYGRVDPTWEFHHFRTTIQPQGWYFTL